MRSEEAATSVRTLFQSSYAAFVAYAYRGTGRLDLAEEAVQEAFFCLYRQLRNGRKLTSVKAWMLTVIRREMGQRVRAEVRQREVAEALSASDTSRAAVYSEADGTYDAAEVAKLFSVLTRREEEVILLRLAALKYREIGDHLGISPKTVSALLTRALRKLQSATKPQSRDSVQEDSHDVASRTLQ